MTDNILSKFSASDDILLDAKSDLTLKGVKLNSKRDGIKLKSEGNLAIEYAKDSKKIKNSQGLAFLDINSFKSSDGFIPQIAPSTFQSIEIYDEKLNIYREENGKMNAEKQRRL